MPGCSKCKKNIEKNSVFVCGLCKLVVHGSCDETISKANLDLDAVNSVGFRWFCRRCAPTFDSVAETLVDSFAEINSSIALINERISKIERNKLPKSNSTHLESENSESYANIVKSSENVIIVRAKNGAENGKEIAEKLKSSVRSEQVSDIIKASNRLVIKSNNSDVSEFLNNVQSSLGENYIVSKQKNRVPKVKIIGFVNINGLSDEDIVKVIIDQNKDVVNADDKLVIVKKYENKSNPGSENLILEVSLNVYNRLIQKGFICVLWSRCSVYDAYSVIRCFKCSKLSHKMSQCTSEVCCPKCTGKHKIENCNSSEKKCINCLLYVQKSKQKIDINHPAWDPKCPMIKQRLAAINKNTNRVK